MKILILTGFYIPGYKGGGPIRSIANMLEKLGGEINFSLFTADRDLGDKNSFSGIPTDCWQNSKTSQIYYSTPKMGRWIRLWRTIREFNGDAIYLNSFFSFRFSIQPLIFWRSLKPRNQILIAPRGEFSEGALALKSSKKRAFIAITKTLGLYRGVVWHATSEGEAIDIRRIMGKESEVRLAINIACPPSVFRVDPRQDTNPLRVMFLSRISPKKNLLGAIQMLQQVQCPMVFDVYGPTEDLKYWASCKEATKQLPSHVKFNYCGSLYPAQIPETMAHYELFYLPTSGENFGHVIAEALGCGLPVLISDTTPWRNLAQQKLGWDIPLSQPEHFVAAIESCSRMRGTDYDAWRHSIRSWALNNIGNDDAVEQNCQLFKNLDIKHEH